MKKEERASSAAKPPVAKRSARKVLAICIRNDTLRQMPQPRPVVFFQTEANNEPVRDWLKAMSKEDRKLVGTDIKTVQFRWPLGMPLVDNLGSGLWEVRTRLENRIARTLFFVHEGEIVLLHGLIKKTRKTPTQDRDLALKRKNAYIKSSKK